MPYLASGPGVGQSSVYTFTTSQGQTSFSGPDSNGYVLNYTPGAQFTAVFLGGLRLTPSDYTATDGSSIVLNSSTSANNTLMVVSQSVYSPADVYSTSQIDARIGSSAIRGYIDGLILSAAGSVATFSIAAGMACADDASRIMTLSSNMTKSTSAWVAGTGNGALDTGTIAANTWYHVFLIQRLDTGVVDVLVSTSSTAPKLPTDYTKKRRIGSIRTDASNNWLAFSQTGDEFLWISSVRDANNVSINSTTSSITLTVPPSTLAFFAGEFLSPNTTSSGGISLFSPNQNITSGTAISLYSANAIASVGDFKVRTNSSSQISGRTGTIQGTLYIDTLGWVDSRGKDS